MFTIINAVFLFLSIFTWDPYPYDPLFASQTLPPFFDPHIPNGEELQEKQREEERKYRQVPRDENGNELC